MNGVTKTGNSTFTVGSEGEYTVTVQAENTAGLTSSKTYTITVNNIYSAVDNDESRNSFVDSGPSLIKYDEDLNEEWRNDTGTDITVSKPTANFAFAYRDQTEDLLKFNKTS